MIDLSKIKANAKSISEKGLDAKILAEAKKYLIELKKKQIWFLRNTLI